MNSKEQQNESLNDRDVEFFYRPGTSLLVFEAIFVASWCWICILVYQLQHHFMMSGLSFLCEPNRFCSLILLWFYEHSLKTVEYKNSVVDLPTSKRQWKIGLQLISYESSPLPPYFLSGGICQNFYL